MWADTYALTTIFFHQMSWQKDRGLIQRSMDLLNLSRNKTAISDWCEGITRERITEIYRASLSRQLAA
jgi:hypothetical protein